MQPEDKKQRWPTVAIIIILVISLYLALGNILLWSGRFTTRSVFSGKIFSIDAGELESAYAMDGGSLARVDFEAADELAALAEDLNNLRFLAWFPELISRGGWTYMLHLSKSDGEWINIEFGENWVQVGRITYYTPNSRLGVYAERLAAAEAQ